MKTTQSMKMQIPNDKTSRGLTCMDKFKQKVKMKVKWSGCKNKEEHQRVEDQRLTTCQELKTSKGLGKIS